MDSFSIIQNFFARMRCHFCTAYLSPEGIELLREDKGVFIVNIHCTECAQQMGVAMVGLEGAEIAGGPIQVYEDPELTEEEMERLATYQPIGFDDVLDAHTFFTNLGADWHKHLPPIKTPELEITSEPESLAHQEPL